MRAVCILCFTIVLLAQTDTATFRAGTQEVLVDAVVVDKKGNFQRDRISVGDYHKLNRDGSEYKGGTTDLIRDIAIGTGGKYTAPGSYERWRAIWAR
jgi:hypothetical protein